MRTLVTWFTDRVGTRTRTHIPSISWRRALPATLVGLLAMELLTGATLAAYYSPSVNAAWASLAYLQQQVSLGWLVRGLHAYGGSALVLVMGFDLAVGLWRREYQAPRELGWWVRVGSMVVLMATGVTGFVLRWDQAGYWAAQVELGIIGQAPGLGPVALDLVRGGNDIGNLTVLRFFVAHAFVLPLLLVGAQAISRHLERRAQASPVAAWPAYWPQQAVRDLGLLAITLALLLGVTLYTGGASLEAPADSASTYDARPLWYFRWLFWLRHALGSAEFVATFVLPPMVLGLLAALPVAGARLAKPLRLAALMTCVAIAALTGISVGSDARNPEYQKSRYAEAQRGQRALALAVKYGVPETGGLAVFQTPPMWKARTLFRDRCAECHTGEKRSGPDIGPGFGNAQWLLEFLRNPNHDRFYGRTKLGKTDDAMAAVELPDADLQTLVKWLEGQRGTVDASTRQAGEALFDANCADCHSREPWTTGASAPALGGWGTREYLYHQISNAKSPLHLGGLSEMPRFDQELSAADREALVTYLQWLRDASPADVAGQEPLE